MVKKNIVVPSSIPEMLSVQRWQSMPVPARPLSDVTVESCGKVIMTGEHAVMYGAKAVAAALVDKRMFVSVSFHDDIDSGVKVFLFEKDFTAECVSTIHKALELLRIKVERGMSVHIQSHIPLGAGLGASAALCVGVIRALAACYDITLSSERLMGLANILEERFHGSPSGLDVAAVCLFSVAPLISFAKREGKPHYVTLPSPRCFHFWLVDSTLRSSTKAMVERSGGYFSSSQCAQRVAAFDDCHDLFVKACRLQDHNLLAQSMTRSAELLSAIDVVGARLSQMMEKLLDLGVLAAKPTGSGGAGYVLVLLPSDPQQRQSVCEHIESHYPQSAHMELVI
ncbi:MAG: hypothetical protein OXC44_06795 [Proteobacteria bacterium]|nr:hypothetical protein [Pseudomonadota bacterium]